MQLAHIYVHFPGTAEEALRYYETVFGTRIVAMQTFGDAPFVKDAPESAKRKIMHAQLPITETVHLMASDVVEGFTPKGTFGTNFKVVVVAKDKEEADRAFEALSNGGKVTMPIGNAPWGPYFGMCVDRFGVGWMVSLPHPV
jgi:PhnB protein